MIFKFFTNLLKVSDLNMLEALAVINNYSGLIALLALFISVLSFFAAKKSADAAARTATIHKDRLTYDIDASRVKLEVRPIIKQDKYFVPRLEINVVNVGSVNAEISSVKCLANDIEFVVEDLEASEIKLPIILNPNTSTKGTILMNFSMIANSPLLDMDDMIHLRFVAIDATDKSYESDVFPFDKDSFVKQSPSVSF